MACIRCQRDVPADAVFCPACGARQAADASSWGTRRLVRIPSEQKIAGVCAGIAEYFGWDVTLFRVAFVLVSIVSAAFPGIFVYLLLWALMPRSEAA